MKLLYGAYTDKGSREENQDEIMILETSALLAFAVADGIGGLSFGKQAAFMSLDALKKELEECETTEIKYLEELIRLKLKQINEYLYSYSQKNRTDMGTTISLLLFLENNFILCNVGDTKIFRIQGDTIQVISKVHSLTEKKNALTMAIGPRGEIDPYIIQGVIQVGDIYVICSDGVYNFVDEDTMKSCFNKGKEMSNEVLEQLCRELAEMALSNGSEDNLSIIAVKIQ